MEVKLFAAFCTDVMDEIPGKKAFQKLVYFGQVLGIPFKQSYKMHYFGPYSETVAEEMARAVSEGILSNEHSYFYAAGVNADELINKHLDDISFYYPELEKLIAYFGDMSPSDLELYATTHYIDNTQKHLYNNYERDSIIDIVQQVKGSKFKKPQIEEAYNKLSQWNLLYTGVN